MKRRRREGDFPVSPVQREAERKTRCTQSLDCMRYILRRVLSELLLLRLLTDLSHR